MTADLIRAQTLLADLEYTCVLCRGESVCTDTRRGVAPLLTWLDSQQDLQGFSAADKVVGKAAAFLYCLLGIKAVYAPVMSRAALEVLTRHGIGAHYDTLTEGIINRRKTGPCPMEAATKDISDPKTHWRPSAKRCSSCSKLNHRFIAESVSFLRHFFFCQTTPTFV